MDPTWRHYQSRLNGEPSRAWLATMAVVSFAAAALILALAL